MSYQEALDCPRDVAVSIISGYVAKTVWESKVQAVETIRFLSDALSPKKETTITAENLGSMADRLGLHVGR